VAYEETITYADLAAMEHHPAPLLPLYRKGDILTVYLPADRCTPVEFVVWEEMSAARFPSVRLRIVLVTDYPADRIAEYF
jgi:hypothetical protein